jgi:DNA primase
VVNLSEEKKVSLLKKILGKSYNKGEEYLFYCPKCDHHKRKLSINIQKNVFKCWVCDWSGRDIYRIIRRYGDYNVKGDWRNLDQKIEIHNFHEKLFGVVDKIVPQKIDLPNEFISLVNKNLPRTSILPLNYLESRGVFKDDVVRWKIGYCSSGEYGGRIVIPSFDCSGDVNYYVTRSYDHDWRKYLNPKVSKNIIFNHLYLDFDEDLIIVEGVFDAIKADNNAVPLLGSTLTENSMLFYEIIKNDTPVYLALDLDADKKTNKLIDLFLKYDIEVYRINIEPYNDVGEMFKSQFLERKQNSVCLNSDNHLLNRIREI